VASLKVGAVAGLEAATKEAACSDTGRYADIENAMVEADAGPREVGEVAGFDFDFEVATSQAACSDIEDVVGEVVHIEPREVGEVDSFDFEVVTKEAAGSDTGRYADIENAAAEADVGLIGVGEVAGFDFDFEVVT